MSFLCCCCNNKSRKLTITNHELNPARTAGTFVQKQPANGVRNAVSMQPTVTKVYKVNRIKPVHIGSSHVGHSNHGYIHEHTAPHTPLPTLPPISDGIVDKNPDINPDHQIVGTQINVSSIGTPTHELELDISQEIVDSSIKTEWKKPEGAIEIIPTVEENPMPSTSATTTNSTDETNFGSSQVVVESLTKTESKEREHFDKTTIDKNAQIIVNSSSDNPIVSTQITTESAATGELTAKNEIVGIPIVPIIDDHKTETVFKPVENDQFGSSQMVELKKTEGVEIIPSIEPTAPPQSIVINDSGQSNQMISTQTITSSTVTKTETIGQHSTQMTSSTSGGTTTVYQATNTNPDINSQINLIVTSIIANENAFGKKTIDAIPSTSTTMHVTEVHEIEPITSEHIITSVGPDRIVTSERIVSSVDDEISEAFKDFVGGLLSTTPEAQKIQPIFNVEQQQQGIPMDVTVTSTDGPASLPMDSTVSTTIEAAKDIISNEMAPSGSVEVIESIPSVVEVVTTQPTSTGYEETKVIATKFTSDGPTFLEVSKTGFHTDSMMTSSTTELHSSQVISKSTFSYEDDQLISASNVFSDSSESKNETSIITTTSSSEQQTFSSFTEFSSSSTQHIVSSPDQDTFKSITISTPVDEDGPTIVEISSSSVEVNTPPTSTTYIVSEPSYEREISYSPVADYGRSSSPAADYGGSSYSPAADYGDSSYSYDDGGYNDD